MSRQLNNYCKASIPEPYTILGVRLRPFSLGSYFLMQRFDVAFISDDKDRTGSIPDLLLAICICSRTYDDFLAFIAETKTFNRWCKDWGKQVRKLMKKDKNFNILYKFMDFEKYMKEGVVIPKYFEGDNSDENAQTSGAHWTQSVLLVLTSELGYSYNEAIDMPVSKALADYFKWSENNGMVTLMNDEELEMVENMEKQQNGTS